MNLKDKFKDQFTNKWWSLLEHNFEADYMKHIMTELQSLSKKGHYIFPNIKDVFVQFKECDYDQVLACIITADPMIEYKAHRMWQNMSRMIEKECFDELWLELHENPNYLLKQGVFNLPLTRTTSYFLSDYNHVLLGWQNFTRNVMKQLSCSSNKIFFLYEDSCEEIFNKVDSKHSFVKFEEGCFHKLNKFMKEEYNTIIDYK